MKKAIVSVLILVSSVLVVGCGATQKSAEEAVGVYRGTGTTMKQLGYEYFVITPDQGLYTLEHITKAGADHYQRDYKAELKKLRYEFDGKRFSSGDLQGEKLADGNTMPPVIATLLRVVDRSKALRAYLLTEKIELEVRPSQAQLQFTEAQVKHLEVLMANKEKLADYMKTQKLNYLWVTDYTNADYYVNGDRFNLPAGITRDPSRTLDALK